MTAESTTVGPPIGLVVGGAAGRMGTRIVALARILMPRSHVRLSAGRAQMSDEMQALCFLAGANSIFYGEKLLTTGNPDTASDHALFGRLGIRPEPLTGAGS